MCEGDTGVEKTHPVVVMSVGLRRRCGCRAESGGRCRAILAWSGRLSEKVALTQTPE